MSHERAAEGRSPIRGDMLAWGDCCEASAARRAAWGTMARGHGGTKHTLEAQRPGGSVDQNDAALVDRLTSGPVGKGGRRIGVHDESCPYLRSPCGER